MVAQQTAQAVQGVPFLDLSPAHAPLKERLLGEIGELFDTGAFTNGPAVAEFEAAFAEYCGVDHCVGVASGLDALRLGLLATGLEPDDEVIVPAIDVRRDTRGGDPGPRSSGRRRCLGV